MEMFHALIQNILSLPISYGSFNGGWLMVLGLHSCGLKTS